MRQGFLASLGLVCGLALAFAWFAAGLALTSSTAAADSFTPVRMDLSVSATARRAGPLPIRVAVSADPGVLDGSDGPVRIQVKLAGECGGSFQTTPGDTLIDQALHPQPATGRPFSATAQSAGRPSSLGMYAVCAYIEDTGSGRVYANDESLAVDVTQACTTAAGRYDAAQRSLAAARARQKRARGTGARRRAQRTVTSDRRAAARDHAQARASCGSDLPL